MTQTLNLNQQAQKMSKYISSHGVIREGGNIWICRAFFTSTRPCEKQFLDKETCEKVKEKAEAITEGIRDTRETGKFVRETVCTDSGTVITAMAKKAIEKAKEASDGAKEEEKGVWQKVKEVVYGKDKEN